MPGDHTEEDFKKLEDRNASLQTEITTQKAETEKVKSALDDVKKKTDGEDTKVKDLQAKLQANEEETKIQKEKMQAMENDKKTRDEKEKHEMATKVANYEVTSEKINDSEVDNRIKELEKNDANVLQAMLPFAEGEAKNHKEAKQAKQALAGNSSKPRYEMTDAEVETANKQASDTKDFISNYRSGFY